MPLAYEQISARLGSNKLALKNQAVLCRRANSLLQHPSCYNLLQPSLTLFAIDLLFLFSLERNQKDYVEVMPEERRQRPTFVGRVLLGQVPPIVAKGVCLDRYQPLKEFPDLYARFAKLRSQEDVVKFVRAYGPLTEEGLHGGKGDDLFHGLRQAESMAAGNLHVGLVLCTLNAKLVADYNGIHLKAEPINLLDALWLQFAQASSKGLANRCEQCGKLYATGPDAKRRRHTKFCSVKCKTKYHSLKRSRP